MTGIIISIILSALISIATIALMVLLGVWVYRDSTNKGMNGILWTAIAMLVPGFVGLIIYLIVRMDNKKVVCSNCAKSVNGKDKFCANCGVELVPAVDASDDVEFKKSQKKVLIGFFSTLAAIVVMTIFMFAAIVTGVVDVVNDAIEWVSGFDAVEWVDTLEDTLGDLDVLFDEEAWHLSIDGDSVEVTDKEGNELITIDGTNETVDVDINSLRELLEEYGVTYDEHMSEEEMEALIKQQIEEALADALDETSTESTEAIPEKVEE